MKTIRTELIAGKTYALSSDGTYDPPLPPEEVSRREARLPLFQEELKTGKVARGMTDDVAINGMESIAQLAERDPAYVKRLARITEQKFGYRIKGSDCYNPLVAQEEGDVMAYFNHGQGRGHAKRLAEERNITVTGMVEHQSHEPDEDPFTPVHKLNPKIVKRKLRQKIKENPDLARADQRELVSNIIDTHASR